jgi:hypothetical protein
MGGQQQVQQPMQQQMPQQQMAPQQPMMQQPMQQPMQPQIQIASNGMAVLKVIRKNSFFGVVANMMITLDGANPQQLSNDQVVTYNLTPGQHIVSYKIWSRRKKEVTIMAQPGQTYSIVFQPDWLWGGFKINNSESKLQ